MTEPTNWEAVLLGEKLVFTLCGRILYEELDRAWLQTLIDDDVFSDVPFSEGQERVQEGLKYLNAWANQNKSGLSEQSFLDLQTDYAHMFLGIGKVPVPVWESVYFSDAALVFQAQTLDVRNWYRRFHLEVEKLHQEPDDHIGLELQFIAHLAGLGLEALDKQDESMFQETITAQRDFLNKHLLKWIFKWEKLLLKHARTDFYKGVGLLAVGAIIESAQQVDALIPME
ncbi:MAG TPA: molecular chaperone TorD family protein [Anaerolineales bacterium]|nr:molecular chaperone TorD family protein [Anaerolineales bacterium]